MRGKPTKPRGKPAKAAAKPKRPRAQQSQPEQPQQPQRQPAASPEQHAEAVDYLRQQAASEQDPQRQVRLNQLADLNQSFAPPRQAQPSQPEDPAPPITTS